MQICSVARAVTTADGKAMLEVAGQPLFELNAVAAAIWTELSEGASSQEVISQLKRRFEVPGDRIARDVNSFVEPLKQNQLVEANVRTPDFHVALDWSKRHADRGSS